MTQEKLPDPRWCGVRIDSSQDSTLCSTGTGGASEHPVYLSTAINAGATKRGDMGGMAVVAFLPGLKRKYLGTPSSFEGSQLKDVLLVRYFERKRYLLSTV